MLRSMVSYFPIHCHRLLISCYVALASFGPSPLALPVSLLQNLNACLPTPLPFQLLYALNARYSSFPYLSARQPRLSCLPPSPLLCSSRHTLPHYSLSFSHTHTPAPSSFRCPHLNIAFSRREAPRLGPHLFEFSPSRFPFYPLKSHAAKRPSRSSRVDRPRLSITPSFSQPARCFLLSPKHPPPFVVR